MFEHDWRAMPVVLTLIGWFIKNLTRSKKYLVSCSFRWQSVANITCDLLALLVSFSLVDCDAQKIW